MIAGVSGYKLLIVFFMICEVVDEAEINLFLSCYLSLVNFIILVKLYCVFHEVCIM